MLEVSVTELTFGMNFPYGIVPCPLQLMLGLLSSSGTHDMSVMSLWLVADTDIQNLFLLI
jgi:hypothetical protein